MKSYHTRPISFPADPSFSASELILNWLEANGMSQKMFAAVIGLSESMVSMLLNKKRKLSLGYLALVAEATLTQEADWVAHMSAHKEWSRQADSVTAEARPQASILCQQANLVENGPSLRAGILSNVDIRKQLAEGQIKINPFEESRLMSSSIDLTLGFSKRLSQAPWTQDNNFKNSNNFAKRGERDLIVQPGESWLVWAAESIWLSQRFCGRIGSMFDLIASGIFLNSGTQIDPGWRGNPFVTLFNPTAELFELDLGQAFMTFEIHALSSPAEIQDSPYLP